LVHRVVVEGASVPFVSDMAVVLGSTAEEVFTEIEAPHGSKAMEAIAWLRTTLAAGPMWVADLQRRASEDGMSWRTIRRVQGRAGVRQESVGGRSLWSIPVFTPHQETTFAQPAPPTTGFQSPPSRPNREDLWPKQAPASGRGPAPVNRWNANGQVGRVDLGGLHGHAGTPGQDPPEAAPLHPDHRVLNELVEAAIELMSNSTFDETTPDPKRAVVQSVLPEVAPQWAGREDIINAVMRRLPDPER
jgi:hypothetical protein